MTLEEAINNLISDLRKGDVTRFSGGGSIFSFYMDRPSAFHRVEQFIRETKSWTQEQSKNTKSVEETVTIQRTASSISAAPSAAPKTLSSTPKKSPSNNTSQKTPPVVDANDRPK